MKSFSHHWFVRGAALSASLLVWALCVHAASAAYVLEQVAGPDEAYGDFVVGPTKVELGIEPGKTQTIELMVTNRMGSRRVFNLEVEDAKGSNDPNQTVVLLGDDRGPYSLKDYISFPEKSFELDQGQRARIPVSISVPADAQPGGLYGSVLVTTNSLPGEDDEAVRAGAKAGSVIVTRIGSLFFITVPGAVERDGRLQQFSVVPEDRMFFSTGPIPFQILFENTGSVHLNPAATLSVRNMLGDEVGSTVIEPWYAFPQSVRRREITWDREFLFGKYTAHLSLNRGYDNHIDTASVTFVVIPWTLMAAVFGGLVLVFFFFRFIIRTFEIKRR